MSADVGDDGFIQDDPSLPQVSTSGDLIGLGSSGQVISIDEYTVVKIAPTYDHAWTDNDCLEDIRIERSVYEHLGPHPRICRYISSVQRGIVLEKFGVALRRLLLDLQQEGKTPSLQQSMKWSRQVAEGVAYLHSKGVVQGDIGCHNILLNSDEIKLCDFGGSSLHGEPAKVGYECRSQRWDENDENPSIRNEIFALGSTIYEIWTTKKPYQDETEETVEQNYKCELFPDVKSLPASQIIQNCWQGTYQSAKEVVTAIYLLQNETTPQHKYFNVNNWTALATFASIATAFIVAVWIHQPDSIASVFRKT